MAEEQPMSDTPRTDEAVSQILQTSQHERVRADFARELERELIQLYEQYDELVADHRAVIDQCNVSELQAGVLQNKLTPLEPENAELRRTHQGGQTGVECAELAAQNHALRVQLSKAVEERKNYFKEIESLWREINQLRSQRQVS
jgi:predicted nuclease with TOPRIM domain